MRSGAVRLGGGTPRVTALAFVEYDVRPTITPRASDRQRGASSPLNAGTKYTPAVSPTLAASSSDSAAELMTCAVGLARRASILGPTASGDQPAQCLRALCICAASGVTCSLSRSQLTPAPAMAMLPAHTAGGC